MDFVLVHGAYHGRWCWSRVEPELTAHGHTVTSVELPISDPDAGLAEYRDTVIDAIADMANPVVVGHSMAGVIIPLVAERRAVVGLIFLCAFIPEPGRSLNDSRKSQRIETYQLTTAEFEDRGEQVWMIGAETAQELFYHDADEADAELAYGRLRPQCYAVFSEKSPLAAWPECPSAYILCSKDRALDPTWSRLAALERLGVTAFEMPGAHSPFITRPGELAAALEDAAGTF